MNKGIFAKNEFFSLFSLHGIYTTPQILYVLGIIYLCEMIVKSYHYPCLSVMVFLLLFYPAIVAIQKRCRDIHIVGTGFILCYSLAVILSCIANVTGEAYQNFQYINFFNGGLYFIILVLCFIPSKSNPDMNLRSPLLKYPFLYTAICWVLAIAATLAVNYYAGIEVF